MNSPWHRWSSAEDAILRERWSTGGMNAVREHLPGPSENSTRHRVQKLGLHVDSRAVIRRKANPKGCDASQMDIAFWLASLMLSATPKVPSKDRIIERWNVSTATAHRWRRWAFDKLEQIQAWEPSRGHADH